MKTANTRTGFAAVVLCGLVAGTAPLHAQPRGATVALDGDDKPWSRGVALDARQAARELFLEGNRLFYIPLYTRAAEKYVAALGKWKHPAFYFNLALTQINLGQEAEAHENLKQAVRQGEEPLGALQFQEAQKQLQELEHQLGRLRIACPTPGAEVTLDGEPLFTAPGSREVWVKATPHEIAAKRAEYVAQARRVAVTSGKLEPVDLSLHKLVEDRPWAVWKPWAVVGLGVAIAGTSGVLHALSARNFNAYDTGFRKLPCAATGCTDAQVQDMNPHLPQLMNRAKLEQNLAVAGYITGGAAIAAGAVLAYLNRPHLAEQGSAGAATPAVTVVPALSADSVGFVVTVSH